MLLILGPNTTHALAQQQKRQGLVVVRVRPQELVRHIHKCIQAVIDLFRVVQTAEQQRMHNGDPTRCVVLAQEARRGGLVVGVCVWLVTITSRGAEHLQIPGLRCNQRV